MTTLKTAAKITTLATTTTTTFSFSNLIKRAKGFTLADLKNPQALESVKVQIIDIIYPDGNTGIKFKVFGVDGVSGLSSSYELRNDPGFTETPFCCINNPWMNKGKTGGEFPHASQAKKITEKEFSELKAYVENSLMNQDDTPVLI